MTEDYAYIYHGDNGFIQAFRTSESATKHFTVRGYTVVPGQSNWQVKNQLGFWRGTIYRIPFEKD